MTPMGPPRSPVLAAVPSSSHLRAAHSLALLSEYAHTLDSVPLDLSRNFADLRELDAVLSSSITSVTSKVIQLTSMVETRSASKEDRLWLLAEIADEVSKLKPGADDKIRVACQAADQLKANKTHMSNLLQHMPDPEYGNIAGMLSRKTVYPHVATRSYVPAGMSGEGGRRQRRTALLANGGSGAMEATPNKRKRVAADDGDLMRSPAKPKTGDASRARNGARSRKCVISTLCSTPYSQSLATLELTVPLRLLNLFSPCSPISLRR
jgi:inhibitor of growth protein 3